MDSSVNLSVLRGSVVRRVLITRGLRVASTRLTTEPQRTPRFTEESTTVRDARMSGAPIKDQRASSAQLLLVVPLLLFVCCKQPPTPHNYPVHWWTRVTREGAPEWEILPQEALPGEVILSKRHELGLLSNFAATPFVFHGKRYASLEGFWQMMLYPENAEDPRAKFPGLEWKYTRDQVAAMTSFEAKSAGTLAEENMKKMGIDWVSFEGNRFEYRPSERGEHYRLIVEATQEKVKQNPEVRKVLLSTGDLVLKPDHHQEPNAPDAWRYYEILTTIRGELQKQAK